MIQTAFLKVLWLFISYWQSQEFPSILTFKVDTRKQFSDEASHLLQNSSNRKVARVIRRGTMVLVCVSVYVKVCERDRERERPQDGKLAV